MRRSHLRSTGPRIEKATRTAYVSTSKNYGRPDLVFRSQPTLVELRNQV